MNRKTLIWYLTIPEGYAGGLRWSASGEAVEYAADEPRVGVTFALNGEVAKFLEGLASQGPLPHFAFVLHLLDLIGVADRNAAPEALPPRPEPFEDLARTFREANRPLRNAGALCGRLCRDVPRPASPPTFADVEFALNRFPVAEWVLAPADLAQGHEQPPLDAGAFERHVADALARVPAEEVRHWLRHGRGPVGGAGEAAARVLPPTLGDAIASAGDRPRLRGAAALAARLAGALALPPRRLAHAELPLGGYTDVATRGLPEQILPGQFALDPDEFLRRYAEHELLFFHREEPHAPAARELLLVVDQGVRTWGDVRLVLAAAALAMGRQAVRRGQDLRVATTGNLGEPVDPLAGGPESLGALLERSDLSPSPARALANALRPGPGPGLPRDVVLLTHPRNLAAVDVEEAARSAAREPSTRVFAVGVDASGAVELSELRGGRPVALGRCRVEVGERPAGGPTSAGVGAHAGAWAGDVEPIGFPFRIGPTEPIDDRLIAFDDVGDRLLLAGRHGFLRVWRTDGTGGEMLPRPTLDGAVMTAADTVVGVADGFVIAGAVGGQQVAARYDFGKRSCRAYRLGKRYVARLSWSYSRSDHAMVAYTGKTPLYAIDLASDSSEAIFSGLGEPTSPRAARAFHLDGAHEPEVYTGDGTLPAEGRVVCLRPGSGMIGIRDDNDGWRSFLPASDGRPKLLGGRIVRARWQGNVLAAVVELPDRKHRSLHAFSVWGHWRPIAEWPLAGDVGDFAMTRDGRKLAWRVGDRRIEVHDLERSGAPAFVVTRGRVHSQLDLELGDRFFAAQAGRHAHLVRWDRGRLEHSHRVSSLGAAVASAFGNPRQTVRAVVDEMRGRYGQARFATRCTSLGLTASVDRLGQVALTDGDGRLLAMFFLFRDQFAAWLPDGTRLGPVALTGGPAADGTAERIGRVLEAESFRAMGLSL